MKLTRHNGRAGKNGTYNPKHNDRRFDVENSDHIDTERAKQNIYWDCFNGYRTFADREEELELAATFEEVEQLYYVQKYSPFVEGQNARNAQTRHTERNRSIEEIRMNKRPARKKQFTRLEIWRNTFPRKCFLQVVTEFIAELNRRFGSHIHTLDWALHLDESTPHIHERHVFDCENKYGELFPQQEKALEALGFELPEPEKSPADTTTGRWFLIPPAGCFSLKWRKSMACTWRKNRSMGTEISGEAGLYSCKTKGTDGCPGRNH